MVEHGVQGLSTSGNEMPSLTETPMTRPLSTHQGLFRSTDGTSIYYEVRGEGRPLIFCYGLVCEMAHWRHQIEHLAPHYQVIAFDYRGHHRSSLPTNDRNLTLSWCARDIEALIQHLNLKEVLCLGHSMGVPVLSHLAQGGISQLKGLVFVCGSNRNPFQHMFNSDKMLKVHRVGSLLYNISPNLVSKTWRLLTQENGIGYFITSQFGFNPRLSQKKDILMYMRSVNRVPFWVFESLIRDYSQFEGDKLLKSIQCPTLVIAGEEDLITPVHIQEEMARLIKNCRLVRIPGGSHNAHMDRPNIVNDEIDVFLRSLNY